MTRASLTGTLRRDGLKILAVVLLLLLVFGRGLVAHMVSSADPLLFTDDARQQIYPFFKYYDFGSFPNDYAAAYYRACYPIGFQALYTLGGLIVDPATISKVLPFLLLVVVLGAVAAAAKRLAGYVGAFVAMAMVLSSTVFLERLVGGLPRSFGYPLAALAALGLVRGNVRFLCILVCVGAAFYPAGAMPAGLALTLLLFALPAADRGEAAAWPLKKRFFVLVAVGLLSALLLTPTLIAARGYGRTLRPAEQLEYPELGPGGRYGFIGDRSPFASFPDEALTQTKYMLRPAGAPLFARAHAWTQENSPIYRDSRGQSLFELIAALLITGGLVLAARNPAGRRLLLFGAAAWFGHWVARPLAPYFYLPQRYSAYPVPILLVLLVPACAAALGDALAKARSLWLRRWIPVALAGTLVLVPFAGAGNARVGLTVDARPRQGLYAFLAKLPADTMIAGWPTDMDNVPYASRRQVLLHYEIHQAFHEQYALELRRRMRGLVDAYFATDLKPLLKLRDDFGVAYLVVRPSYFTKPPGYFAPFGAWTTQAFFKGRAKGFEIPRQMHAAQVYRDDVDVVLDLTKLRAAAPVTP